jgi:hypothetical protein
MIRGMKKNVVPDPLREVVARFPGSEARIRELFQGGEQFRELCADHGECMKALQRFRKMGTDQDGRIEQYTELLVSLEAELFVRISEPANDETAVEGGH